MFLGLAKRMVVETDPRLLAKFVYNFSWKGMRAVQRFERRLKRGEFFPAVTFISVTNRCNLRCQGCWVNVDGPAVDMPSETVDNIITACKEHGSYFFGILGGEPLLYSELFHVIERHPDCYFQVLTNGTCLNDVVAGEMRRLGNVTPLISIEGMGSVSDERRGGDGVYDAALAALDCCQRARLITGVATSVCRSNIDDLVSDRFVSELIARKVHYLWYYIYRPVGANPTPELALNEEQILRLRSFIVETRCHAPIMLLDAYWDHQGRALCPAAVGISHHINPSGGIEPCPPIQFACDSVGDGTQFAAAVSGSEFLAHFRRDIAAKTRGCVLLEDPQALQDLLQREGARDCTGRGTGFEELAAMRCCPGHHLPGKEIPEKHWLYRFSKKHWFFGFGAYG